MNMKDRLDPELAAPLEAFLSLTGGGLDLYDIPATRRRMERADGNKPGRVSS